MKKAIIIVMNILLLVLSCSLRSMQETAKTPIPTKGLFNALKLALNQNKTSVFANILGNKNNSIAELLSMQNDKKRTLLEEALIKGKKDIVLILFSSLQQLPTEAKATVLRSLEPNALFSQLADAGLLGRFLETIEDSPEVIIPFLSQLINDQDSSFILATLTNPKYSSKALERLSPLFNFFLKVLYNEKHSDKDRMALIGIAWRTLHMRASSSNKNLIEIASSNPTLAQTVLPFLESIDRKLKSYSSFFRDEVRPIGEDFEKASKDLSTKMYWHSEEEMDESERKQQLINRKKAVGKKIINLKKQLNPLAQKQTSQTKESIDKKKRLEQDLEKFEMLLRTFNEELKSEKGISEKSAQILKQKFEEKKRRAAESRRLSELKKQALIQKTKK